VNGGENSEPVLIQERRGAVLVLTFNRPDRLNGWNDELEDEYFDALDAAEVDDGVRALVVTGAGRGFCAGADMDVLTTASKDEDLHLPDRSRPRHHPLSIRKPIVAAVNGAAAGLGLVEAVYCDVRFAVPTAKLTTAFAKRGLIAEYGLAWILPRMVGTGRALDLLLSGRIVTGDEALRIGLVDFVVEPAVLLDQAVAYAEALATLCSPVSMATIKAQVYDGLRSDFASAAALADTEMLASFSRADAAEGIDSYLERRPPRFAPLGSRH
jgi:enoyl-CoA hydratase/carnithine racemase